MGVGGRFLNDRVRVELNEMIASEPLGVLMRNS